MELASLLQKLAEAGIAYLLLVISLIANYYLFKLLLAEKDKRVAEAELVRDKVFEPIDNLKTTINSMFVLLQNLSKGT